MSGNLGAAGGTTAKKRKAANSLSTSNNLSGEDLKPSSSSLGTGMSGASTSTATSSTKGRKRGRKAATDMGKIYEFLKQHRVPYFHLNYSFVQVQLDIFHF